MSLAVAEAFEEWLKHVHLFTFLSLWLDNNARIWTGYGDRLPQFMTQLGEVISNELQKIGWFHLIEAYFTIKLFKTHFILNYAVGLRLLIVLLTICMTYCYFWKVLYVGQTSYSP